MLIETAYRTYSENMLQAMIRFSRDEAAAKDAVSQAFTQALMNRAMLEAMPEPAMKAWLYSAARNALIDLKRKESRYTLTDEWSFAESPPWDPTDRLLAENLVEKLPGELQTVVCGKYYEGLSSSEIGKTLGIPASTVRTRLRTALRLMRAMMKGEI